MSIITIPRFLSAGFIVISLCDFLNFLIEACCSIVVLWLLVEVSCVRLSAMFCLVLSTKFSRMGKPEYFAVYVSGVTSGRNFMRL